MTKYIVIAYYYRSSKTLRIQADSLEEASRKAKAELDEGFSRFRIREARP